VVTKKRGRLGLKWDGSSDKGGGWEFHQRHEEVRGDLALSGERNRSSLGPEEENRSERAIGT